MKEISSNEALQIMHKVRNAPVNEKLCKKILKQVFKGIREKARDGEGFLFYTFLKPCVFSFGRYRVSNGNLLFIANRLKWLGYEVKTTSNSCLDISWQYNHAAKTK